jgi:hypothetical protein
MDPSLGGNEGQEKGERKRKGRERLGGADPGCL